MISIRNTLVYSCTILCIVDSVFGKSIDTNMTLELVQVLFRHGARTPRAEETYLVPQYNESFYQPWGFAQLTTQGMIQEYEIGKMLRQRYGNFLPVSYHGKDIYAYSANTERTIASLQLVLAALYQPVTEQIWNDHLNWIPIPVHTAPRPLDILTKPWSCPKYIEEITEVLNSKDIKSAQSDNILGLLSDIFKKPVDYDRMFDLFNLLKINKSLKIPLPQWYTEELYEKMRNSSDFYLEIMSHTNAMKTLNGGILVKTFFKNIVDSKSNKKIHLYSAHEKTLHAFLRFHNITEFGNPDYGSAIIVEKYRSIQNKYYVKLLYRTGESKKMYELKLENCSEICPLKVYSKIIEPSLPTDDDMLCLLTDVGPKYLEKLLNADFER